MNGTDCSLNYVKSVRKINHYSNHTVFWSIFFHPCVSGFGKGFISETRLISMVQSIKC